MVVVIGKTPDEIKISRLQYIDLLDRIDAATRSNIPAVAALGHELLNEVRVWCAQADVAGEVDGQLQLPLTWAGDRAER